VRDQNIHRKKSSHALWSAKVYSFPQCKCYLLCCNSYSLVVRTWIGPSLTKINQALKAPKIDL
jgi:hypothetical protein